jgi:lipoyl(octanoyl) transferase
MDDTASIAAAPPDDVRAGPGTTATDEHHGLLPPALEWRVTPGLTPYPEVLTAMQQRVAAIRAGTAPEKVWLVEHSPLYTAGTSARPEELTDPGRFPTFAAGRGGQWTYHGPGQRTAYVMLDLTRPHGSVPARDIGCYVHGLESWLIGALVRFGVHGERRTGRIGIWVVDPHTGAEAKIGAIGVRVTRWVSWHGVALNVAHPGVDGGSGRRPARCVGRRVRHRRCGGASLPCAIGPAYAIGA